MARLTFDGFQRHPFDRPSPAMERPIQLSEELNEPLARGHGGANGTARTRRSSSGRDGWIYRGGRI